MNSKQAILTVLRGQRALKKAAANKSTVEETAAIVQQAMARGVRGDDAPLVMMPFKTHDGKATHLGFWDLSKAPEVLAQATSKQSEKEKASADPVSSTHSDSAAVSEETVDAIAAMLADWKRSGDESSESRQRVFVDIIQAVMRDQPAKK